MPTAKTLLCACEDVTRAEVRRAFQAGHRDLESVKRYTGFGTGPCQGKSCLALVAQELLRLGATPAEVAPFTIRPPCDPVALSALAGLDPASLPLGGGRGEPAPRPPEQLPRPSAALPARADVVVVGGGIMGLALASELARRGVTDVLVLERGYLNAGASGRNGGGVRAQWTTPTLIRLAKRSLELCRRFAVELGVNVWMRRGGYLFLAPGPAQVGWLERTLPVHEANGLRTRLVTPDEACEVVPQLDRRRFLAASWNPDDAVVFPWPFLWGYAARAQALGAQVATFTRVTGFERQGARLTAVVTDRGRVACETVVNAAGAWSKEVAALCGVALPNRPTRHEILVTEAMTPWLGPLVSVLGNGLYFSQSQRGELVGGMGDPEEPEGLELGTSLRFLARFARAITACAPATGHLRVVRQWAGCYDVTPDNNPILGAAGFENFLQLSGFVGHGFMMAPAVAELMAGWMAGGPPDEIFTRFTVDRFARGALAREEFIIG
ncbi:FAD-dependent oxidoreductase [Anaeromyxobacter diazotrophicus]|uniref:FAD-dependent oxidoreductase n=1 Tax=Anaeromyxobacter diazotrophicus TaxID=2590199 RepID=A0A7I9VIW1_9BACT|nr:FAD-dependent oxidoreductase [Anaeromyxobacter diazotrophicus]GEJ56344.1 FAD-dependent oxidoreductase [Anaeromyxobacter diazotrophicus]